MVDQYKSTITEYIDDLVRRYTSEDPDEWEDWGDITGDVMARCSVTHEDIQEILAEVERKSQEV